MPFEQSARAPFAPTDPIDAGTDLARYFTESGRPAHEWMVGPEVELFGFTRDGLARITPDQVQSIIADFSAAATGLVFENGYLMEAALAAPGAEAAGRITLEPGGQVEFSGAPRRLLSDIERTLSDFLSRLKEAGDRHGVTFSAVGFDPVRGIEEQRWVPKRRYEIMRPYLATRGGRAWDMMSRTAAIQVNLDYSDAEDLAKKFTLANRLGPVAAAMFANSPFEGGRLSGYKTTRYAAWLDTDPDRTGPSPAALADDFSIERFLGHVFQVPMLFVRRGGDYIDYTGHSFAEYLSGCKCPEEPVFQDFTDHLTTLFTEARLKPHIEQRSMDCGPIDWMMAALAFWKGLMYDAGCLEGALRIMPPVSKGEYAGLQLEVARHGLEARAGRRSVAELASEAIALARAGLESSPNEARYLDPLEQYVVRERISPADVLIRNFLGSWNGQIGRAIEYLQVAGGDSIR
jgi:glutamate--cysteine ligase